MSPLLILRAALTLSISVILLHSAWSSLGSRPLFEEFIIIGRWIALTILLLVSIILDRRVRSKTGSSTYFSSAIAGIALLVLGSIMLWENRLNSKEVILRAGQFQDFNGSSLDLYTDGTFRYCDIVLGESCCRGDFIINGDKIDLKSSNCKSGSLIIRHCSVDPKRKCVVWESGELPEMWLHQHNFDVREG